MTITNGATPSPEGTVHTPSVPYPTFMPGQAQQVGSLLPADKFPQNASPPKLFEPITVRGVTFGNRVWVSPMCMYSSDYGHATDHHFVHLGSMAMRGWGSIMVEATGVVPEGRITRDDSGIWADSHVAPFKRIVDYVHANKGIIGIQLAHAGRKASTYSPWAERIAKDDGYDGGETMPESEGGWPNGVVAPSAISFKPGKYPNPVEASLEYIEHLKQAYRDAVERCKAAGFDFIEIHGAHGYLMHEFCSPLTNRRTDQYGGSLENRLRFSLEIAEIIRGLWDKPLFYRVSATEWLDNVLGPEKGGPGKEDWAWWGIEQTTILTQKLADLGVDVIDVSTGGNDLRAQIPVGPSYQVPFAAHIKKHVKNIIVGAVGIITEPSQANDIIENGEADVVIMARELLRDIDFPLKAAEELGVAVNPAYQYELAWKRMVVSRAHTQAKPHGKPLTQVVEGHEGKKTTA